MNIKVIGWLAAAFSLIGVILNANVNIWCWFFWEISNLLWIYWSIKKREWSQLVLWLLFMLTNIYGWYQWYIS